MRVLVIIEHDGAAIRPITLSCLGFARQVASETGGSVTALVLGADVGNIATEAAHYAPVLVGESARLGAPLPEPLGAIVASTVRQRGFDLVCAANSTFSKDFLPRAAALLGGAMATDVLRHDWVEGELRYDCPRYAGSVTATVRLLSGPQVVTIRGSSYPPAERASAPHPIETLSLPEELLESRAEYVGRKFKESTRPDVTEARIVVSGGRAFKTADDFERHVGRLADVMGGAAGSSRALVDAGITPNELQVGQTGKIVAPEIYFALGISGAVQHLAGMKNSRTIVAINSDPDAPIFDVADFGLVGDVYTLVPELIEKLENHAAAVIR